MKRRLIIFAVSLVFVVAFTHSADAVNCDKNPDHWKCTSTPIAPEPISSILFLAGGAGLTARHYWRNRKKV